MIDYQKMRYDDESIYSSLHPLLVRFFRERFGSFSEPQRYGIIPIHEKKNTLIFAPTGTGKTLTAFASVLNELTFLAMNGGLEDRVYCVYISPLKALSRDINVNLKEPLSFIKQKAKEEGGKVNIRVGVRTGDTSASQKSGMLARPPHILITTPESFAIVLTSKKFREHMSNVDWLIVDEIHSLAASKRGVHLSLSVERLAATTEFTRIGLSATVAPIEEVAKFLAGKKDDKNFRDCTIVDAQFTKKMDLSVLCPVKNLIETPHQQVHNSMYDLINNLVQTHKTTLIFTNTRSATERVVHTLKEKFPDQYTENAGEAKSKSLIGAHHGSLSTAHRVRIEDQLKSGELKCIVSSTSLELGIDIGSVDLVILLGSPKSVARALQRIGRSGHRLDEVAKGRIIVLDRDDLMECSVLLKSALEKKIDRIDIPKNPLDVLAQQLFGLAVERKLLVEEAYWLVRKSYCYESLPREDFDAIISYLAGEYVSLEDRHVYAKIWVDKETGMMGARSKLARVLYMTNIGTIPDETHVTVKVGEQIVGKLDEGFLERLKRGDVFVLGGDAYEFLYARGMVASVRTSSGRPPTVPSWVSEMLPLSFDLSLDIQKFRYLMSEQFRYSRTRDQIMEFIHKYLYVDEYGANSIYEYFKEQAGYSEIPSERLLLIEHFKEDDRKHVLVHSLYGRRVNDVLSRAAAYAISRGQHKDVEIAISDNGFMLSYSGQVNVAKALKALSGQDLRGIMEQALDKTEILQRRFRHCAGRALMILRSYMGRQKTVGRQQVSSMLLINAVRRISEDFPVLKEARREVLEDLMDIEHAKQVLSWARDGKLEMREKFLDFPSPFSFNLVLQGYSDIFKVEDKSAFLKRMHQQVLDRIGGEKKEKAFSYSDLWEELQEEKRKQKIEHIEEMQTQLARVKFPRKAKEEISRLIEGAADVSQETIEEIKSRSEEIAAWPGELSRFVLQKGKELDEKTVMLKLLTQANYSAKLDNDVLFQLKRLLSGEREEFPRFFREWLDSFLGGTIGYAWDKKLIYFLRRAKDEMGD